MTKTKDKFLKIAKIAFLSVFVVIAAGILFIKLNTGAAAEFTDNYIRPVFGNKFAAFLEKIYFNTSDKIKQITERNDGASPQFSSYGSDSLTLNPIALPGYLPRVKKEGIWETKSLGLFPGKDVAAYTFVRPDPTRLFAYVTLVQLNMSYLRLGVAAGTKQPGGPIGNPGPGVIPEDIVRSGDLIAAFDGGFQYRDGEYGMIVDGKTYVPLKKGVGTLVGYKDGTLKILTYNGQDLGKDILFIRQNCPILVENGQIFAENENNKKLWGRTFNSDIYTWRSGMGLTSNGNLIYAVGNDLGPESLATALQMAGAINAIQLDINPFWVRFNFFEYNGTNNYKTVTLTKDLKDGSKDYFSGYGKDFFYIYKRQPSR